MFLENYLISYNPNRLTNPNTLPFFEHEPIPH